METQLLGDTSFLEAEEADRGPPVGWLIVQNRSHSLYRGANVIGRSEHVDIVIHDATVTEKHADVHFNNDGQFYVTDLCSVNGTYVQTALGGKEYKRIPRGLSQPVSNGISLRFGAVAASLHYQLTSTAEETRGTSTSSSRAQWEDAATQILPPVPAAAAKAGLPQILEENTVVDEYEVASDTTETDQPAAAPGAMPIDRTTLPARLATESPTQIVEEDIGVANIVIPARLATESPTQIVEEDIGDANIVIPCRLATESPTQIVEEENITPATGDQYYTAIEYDRSNGGGDGDASDSDESVDLMQCEGVVVSDDVRNMILGSAADAGTEANENTHDQRTTPSIAVNTQSTNEQNGSSSSRSTQKTQEQSKPNSIGVAQEQRRRRLMINDDSSGDEQGNSLHTLVAPEVLTSSTTTKKPTSSTTTEEPTSSTATEKPTSSAATEKPTSSTATEKPTSSTATEKPTSSTATEKPTSSTTTKKPTSSTTTEKPTSSAATEKPTSSAATEKPTSSSATEKATAVSPPIPNSRKKVKNMVEETHDTNTRGLKKAKTDVVVEEMSPSTRTKRSRAVVEKESNTIDETTGDASKSTRGNKKVKVAAIGKAKIKDAAPVAAPLAVQQPDFTRVLITGVDKEENEALVHQLNLELTHDPKVATHCVTDVSLKRTPNLMIALNSGVKYIVTEKWLADSAKRGEPIEIPTAALLTNKYIVRDKQKEKLWKFRLAETLQLNHNRNVHGNVFAGYCIYVTKGVCGVSAPPQREMRDIIESGGGEWLTSITRLPANTAEKVIVVSAEDVAKKEVTKTITTAAKSGPGKGIYSIEFVFQSVLRQAVNLDENILNGRLI